MDRGGLGRRRCAGCAYDNGFLDGLERKERLHIDIENLPRDQDGPIRGKSPHAAYAIGYIDGLAESHDNETIPPEPMSNLPPPR